MAAAWRQVRPASPAAGLAKEIIDFTTTPLPKPVIYIPLLTGSVLALGSGVLGMTFKKWQKFLFPDRTVTTEEELVTANSPSLGSMTTESAFADLF